jgi:peptidyl-prolyl cis-trans isomerase D
MLLQFRNMTRGAVATIILGLVGLAMVVFLIPQGGLQLFPSQDLATVGGRSIQAPELTRELQLTLRQQRNAGRNITQAEAIEAGIHRQILEGMIARYAMHEYAKRLGVSAGDVTVASRIREIPSVTNPVTGQFDQTAYDAFLQELGYSRPDFEEAIRGDITTDMLMEAMVAGARAPSSYGALVYTFQTETRIVSLAEAPASVIGQVAPPTEAQLQTYYEQNQERLRIPEFRALTLVYADPADFIARVDVPETRLREEFDARRAALTRPERRTYVRLAAQNEQQANDAAARLTRGDNPQAVAQALGLQLTRGEDQTRADVPDRSVGEAVFALRAGQARAVRGQLTPWVVVRLDSITPAVEPSFDSLRAELRQAIAADEATDLLNSAVTAFEDARSGGASIAEAARQNGLRLVSVPAVEAQGRAPNGAPVEAVAEQAELLRTAFQTPEGEASDFLPVGGADVIVSVDGVTPPTVRPLAEVRDTLSQLWRAEERVRRLRERADQLVAAVRGGQSFAAATRAHGFRIIPPASQAIDRRQASQALPADLAGQIFAAAEGGVSSVIAPDGGAVLVAQVERINRLDPAEQPQAVEQIRGQLQQGLAESFVQAVQGEVLAQARVRRNEELLDQLFRAGNAEDDQAQ